MEFYGGREGFVEAKMSEGWYFIEYGKDNFASVEGLGPCAGIIVYNTKTKNALAIHSPGVIMERVGETLKQELEDFGDIKDLGIFVAGCEISSFDSAEDIDDGFDSEEYVNDLKKNREYILNFIKELGFKKKNIFIKFSEEGETACMFLDLESGECSIEISEDIMAELVEKFVFKVTKILKKQK